MDVLICRRLSIRMFTSAINLQLFNIGNSRMTELKILVFKLQYYNYYSTFAMYKRTLSLFLPAKPTAWPPWRDKPQLHKAVLFHRLAVFWLKISVINSRLAAREEIPPPSADENPSRPAAEVSSADEMPSGVPVVLSTVVEILPCVPSVLSTVVEILRGVSVGFSTVVEILPGVSDGFLHL